MFDKKEMRTKRITFRLSEEELQKIDDLASDLNEKRSDFIRTAILNRIEIIEGGE